MRQKFEYSREDVERIVLDQHAIRFPAAEGMVWAARRCEHPLGGVVIEAVKKAELDTSAMPVTARLGGD